MHVSNDFSKRSLSFFPHLLSILKCPLSAVNGVFNSCEASDTNLVCSSNPCWISSIIELNTVFNLSISSFTSEISALLFSPFAFISFIVSISFLILYMNFLETYMAPIPLSISPKIIDTIKIGKELSIKSPNISFSNTICNVYSELFICMGPVINLYISKSKDLDFIWIFWFA